MDWLMGYLPQKQYLREKLIMTEHHLEYLDDHMYLDDQLSFLTEQTSPLT